MESIYIWLLENTGNEGNYYTILNNRRENLSEQSAYLEIMARRSADFTVVNLLVFSGDLTDIPEKKHYEHPLEQCRFGNEQQVIVYLATGKKPEIAASDDIAGIQVLLVEPAGEAGTITFPADQ
ncbi:hypothetical protein G8759_17430 [Spirosoma aureum]|uniref:Uncharacterized protein n=1 Tax=Spirosoma aureum TaxID=2692134 RepID=A0A6G9APK0_9BACT|nr:hypothetical protein [Spirosoma aureum]QIP14269.1 hypothetical protein G8759_17430 [Spirosoma aureum]